MTRAEALQLELLERKVSRLERAVAELASETHAVSQPAQIAGKGLPSLASLVRDHREARLDTTIHTPEEVR